MELQKRTPLQPTLAEIGVLFARRIASLVTRQATVAGLYATVEPGIKGVGFENGHLLADVQAKPTLQVAVGGRNSARRMGTSRATVARPSSAAGSRESHHLLRTGNAMRNDEQVMMRSCPILPLLIAISVASSMAASPAALDLVIPGASSIAIEPSSASLAGGKARLTTTALRRQAARYLGNYQLKVQPYFFKNESGTLSIAVSDESLRKLAAGTTVHFVGSAVTAGSGKARAVRVKAIPAGVGMANGDLSIAITTENGELVFATAYTLGGG